LTLEKNTELKELIRKNALLNAVKHDGKAQTGAVVGKILGEKADYRSKVGELSALINGIVQEVNDLVPEEQKRIVKQEWPETLVKEKAEQKRLPPLLNADKYATITTRFSPNPDCVLHLGSARSIILSHEYAGMYNGTFILRFEDTDPKVKVPVLEFYDQIRKDLAWLGCKPDKEYIQSDRISIYYEYVEKLILNGHAFVCICKPEDFRKRILINKACPCRDLPVEEQNERWDKMLNGSYKEGEAVVRIKTDLSHPNPAIRDWPAMRIIDTKKHPHPRVGGKYAVWPLYNLAAGLDDHLMGVTHIIRGKEHLTNMGRQAYMYQYLGWKYPEAIHFGRLKIKGAYLSKSKIVQGIREGLFRDWDDPRLATFVALRKRGITPQAITKMIIDVGPKTHDVVLSWENLYAYNRKILDPISERYFFVENPVELKVHDIPKVFKVKLNLHPEYPERGFRKYIVTPETLERSATFWVSRKDVTSLRTGAIIRLMDLFNIELQDVSSCAVQGAFNSESYQDARNAKAHLIHWILVGQDMPCEVIMPDADAVEGIAESYCKKLKPGAILQFERFGFVRIDKLKTKLTTYFAHK
jgi:glutamyl-tRNA synthetase